MSKLTVVILAAGEGTRMKSAYAKVTHKLGGKTIISHVLEAARALDPEGIVVVVGHDAKGVRRVVGEDVRFVEQAEQLGTGHAVMQTSKVLGDYEGDILILSGDVPLIRVESLEKLVEVHRQKKAACTLISAILKNPSGYGRVIRSATGWIQKIVEEKDTSLYEKAVEEINSGIYCFSADPLFRALEKLLPDNRQEEFYLTDVVGIFAGKGKVLAAVQLDNAREILGINSRADLASIEKILQQRIQKGHMINGVTIVSPDTTYIEATVRIGQDTIIYPFTVIEGDIEIGRDCEIGPFSHLRTRTVMKDGAEIGNFVEVKNSIIGEGTKAKHLSYIGDTTIGKEANIGAGSITANYDGKAKHKTVIGDGAFIGSGTTLVAPVIIGKGAITGAGSVVLRGRDVPDGSVVAGVPAAFIKKKEEKKGKEDK